MTGALAHEFAKVLKRTEFVAFLDRALDYKFRRSEAAIERVPEWQTWRDQASRLKAGVRERLDELVVEFSENARAAGAVVHHAADAESANRTVLELCRRANATKLVKSKSMTTEECGLNPFLEEHGLRVTDTDLGERIVQLFGEPPSHIVTPAVHRTRQEIGELFAAHGMIEPGVDDPDLLTAAARKSLRALFLEAELGLTGANFLVAETGTVVVVENECNSLLGTSIPRVHVVVAGIEKLVEKTRDLATFLSLLARSATGQRLTTYTSHYTGPQPRTAEERAAGAGDRELHIVLVDNGRRRLRGTPASEALACIRCGACLTACPVFRRVGGHAYDWVIPGPIGVVLGPGLGGPGQFELPGASSLCGLCSEVCPVHIELAKHIHDWRAELAARTGESPPLPFGLRTLMCHPRLWDAAMQWARRLSFVTAPILSRHSLVRKWTAGGRRRLPDVPAQSFRSWWKARPPSVAADREASAPANTAPNAAPNVDTPPAPAKETALENLFAEALTEAGGRTASVAELGPEFGTHAVATERGRELLAGHGIDLAPAPIDKHELAGVDCLVAVGRWRIARAGAVWVDFADAESRTQLLLPEKLVLLVPQPDIVFDLPEHYERVAREGLPVCATLVTGPSKTADIEGTLVFGAHGPRTLLVCPMPD